MQAALASVRALMDYDAQVLSQFFSLPDTPTAAANGLAEAVRAAAPLVTCKGDWAALYMLLRERGMVGGYADVVRLVAEYAPSSPQPSINNIANVEWDTHRRRFPDWKPEGVRYEKFRSHFLIAQAAAPYL